ncbi:MAG: BPSS1780 family membrane protein [Aliiglaciecola sp.]
MENQNSPYQAPESELSEQAPAADGFQYVGPQNRPTSAGMHWISSGFAIFKQDAGMWVITMFVGLFVALAINFVPVLGTLVSSLINFVWAGGLMLGCQAAYEKRGFELKHLFAGFTHNVLQLILLSFVTSLIGMVLMFTVVGSTYLEILTGSEMSVAPEESIELMLSVLVALALMLPLFMAVWFAPALIVLQNMPFYLAMKESFLGCFKNVLPFLIYGVVTLVLYILGAIPLFLGLLIVVPLIFTSMYTGYRDIFLAEIEKPADQAGFQD